MDLMVEMPDFDHLANAVSKMADVLEESLNGSEHGNTGANAIFDIAKSIRILAENIKAVNDIPSSIENLASAVESLSVVKSNERKLRSCVVKISANICLEHGVSIKGDYKELDGWFHQWGIGISDDGKTYTVGIVEIEQEFEDFRGMIFMVNPEDISYFIDEK